MRRLPVYFLLDTSGSMYGEPIQALNNALSGMINTLRSDAQALDSLWISIITFDREVKEIVPLTELVSFQLPEITCPQSGPTNTGAGLEFVIQKVKTNVIKSSSTQKGDWKPLLFVFTAIGAAIAAFGCSMAATTLVPGAGMVLTNLFATTGFKSVSFIVACGLVFCALIEVANKTLIAKIEIDFTVYIFLLFYCFING